MRELVDPDAGTVSREIFVNPDIFNLEMEQLFARAWLFVGHESQVPAPGDYFVSRMGTESVILTRDSSGELNVLLNSCRHRGMKVCRYDQGNTLQFMCPYHGWAYSIDGSLVSTPGDLYGVPRFRTTYGGQLDKSAWGLARAPQLANYHGLVFASWDHDAPPLEDYVGDFSHWLDALTMSADGRDAQVEVFQGVEKWRIPCNWKFVPENFLGDNYHADTTHSSVEAVGIGPGGRGKTRMGNEHGDGKQSKWRETSFTRLGHGACDNIDSEPEPYPTSFTEPELGDYFRKAWEARCERLARQGRPVGTTGPGTLFPTMSLHAGIFPRTIAVAHPQGPTETEVWRWFLVDKDAPPAVRDWLRHYYMRYSGPAGMVEQDDIENWCYATEASRGVIARRYAYNYEQGVGMGEPGSLRGSVVSEAGATEENARNFYRRWAEFASGSSWAELMAD
jgi:phenylpropionate dioxygenase-like ring-hydroxylating dioxygenase large terminal subunit